MNSPIDSRLGIFLKYPQSGRVKTRLADAIGNEKACDVYKCFVEDVIQRFCPESKVSNGIVGYAPDDSETRGWIKGKFPSHFHRWPQPDGDLGVRMALFFQYSLSLTPSHPSILIGTDSPHIPWDYFIQADQALQENDCVIGPSADGGYYLIGLSRFIPELFVDLPWSQPDLYDRTMQVVEKLGLSVKRLPLWYDVDTIRDLTILRVFLAALKQSGESDFPHQTWEMIQSMDDLSDDSFHDTIV